jgi:hypothetical protein
MDFSTICQALASNGYSISANFPEASGDGAVLSASRTWAPEEAPTELFRFVFSPDQLLLSWEHVEIDPETGAIEGGVAAGSAGDIHQCECLEPVLA